MKITLLSTEDGNKLYLLKITLEFNEDGNKSSIEDNIGVYWRWQTLNKTMS